MYVAHRYILYTIDDIKRSRYIQKHQTPSRLSRAHGRRALLDVPSSSLSSSPILKTCSLSSHTSASASASAARVLPFELTPGDVGSDCRPASTSASSSESRRMEDAEPVSGRYSWFICERRKSVRRLRYGKRWKGIRYLATVSVVAI